MQPAIVNQTPSGGQGRPVAIRLVTRNDSGSIADLYRRLSPESRELRFMAPQGRMSEEETWRQARRVAEGDATTQAALVVVAIVFIIVNWTLTSLAGLLERRLNRRGRTAGDAIAAAPTVVGAEADKP